MSSITSAASVTTQPSSRRSSCTSAERPDVTGTGGPLTAALTNRACAAAEASRTARVHWSFRVPARSPGAEGAETPDSGRQVTATYATTSAYDSQPAADSRARVRTASTRASGTSTLSATASMMPLTIRLIMRSTRRSRVLLLRKWSSTTSSRRKQECPSLCGHAEAARTALPESTVRSLVSTCARCRQEEPNAVPAPTARLDVGGPGADTRDAVAGMTHMSAGEEEAMGKDWWIFQGTGDATARTARLVPKR
jgi:hypothetical protein